MRRGTVVSVFLLCCLTVGLAFAYLAFDPFGKEVLVNGISIDPLTASERTNITVAARALNGNVLRPGETFSFNRAVGPRTYRRGYAKSPSYLDSETPSTFGGGICVLSSLLYQVASKGGLTVVERHQHTRPMKTVKPGLDATVWYGGPDLKFTNSYGFPIQIRARVDDGELRVSLATGRFNAIQPQSTMATAAKGATGIAVGSTI